MKNMQKMALHRLKNNYTNVCSERILTKKKYPGRVWGNT